MKKTLGCLAVLSGMLWTLPVFAQAPAGAPAGATAQCNDNSFFSGATKRGACAGHKGIKTWYGLAAPARGASGAAAPAPNPGALTTPTAKTTPAPMASPAPATARKTPAAGTAAGGAGQVWVNTDTKVYHCAGDRWYGKTKTGAYMSQAEATQKGFRPDHGKACQ